MDKVEQIRNFILARGRLTVSFTGSDDACDELRSALGDWIGRMRDAPVQPAPLDFTPFGEPPREGLAGPVQVAHCAQVVPAPHYSHPDEPLVALGCQIVGCEYMLPEIRLRGGAYGAWCNYHNLESTIILGSFRDPHIARTLDVFARVPEYVRDADWTQDDVERGIIALAKQDEKPIRPADATGLALHRHMIRLTPDMREARHARLLKATVAEVKRALLGVLDANFARSPVCVASSREKLEAANEQMADRPLAIEDILK